MGNLIKKSNESKSIIIIFVLILILQIIAIVYATSQREYYHIDEFYSHGLIQYQRAFIFENEDFLNQWHTKDYFYDYFTINEEKKLDFVQVYKNQIEDVHPPLYYLLLRIACSFNINNFSIWPGTILNIVLFLLSSIMLYLIGNQIFKNKYCSLLLCFINGFSIASIETVLFVRMYQLLILNVLIIIYWHLKRINYTNLSYKKDLIPLFFTIIIGFLTHYYYIIFIIVLYLMYIIDFIKNKAYKEIIKYTSTVSLSIITSICIFPYSIKHIFFSYRGQGVIENFKNLKYILKYLHYNINIINKHFFNDYMYIIFIIIAVLIILLVCKKIKNKTFKTIKLNLHILYILLPLIIYITLISLVSPYYDLRYLTPVIPLVFCILIYLLWYLLKNIIKEKVSLIILLVLVLIFSITSIPKLSNNLYTYKDYKNITNRIKSNISNKPIIFMYEELNSQYSRIMSIYYFTLAYAENSYILPENKVDSDKIKNVLKNIDLSNGIIVIMDTKNSSIFLKELYKTNLFKNIQGIDCFNKYEIYLLN